LKKRTADFHNLLAIALSFSFILLRNKGNIYEIIAWNPYPLFRNRIVGPAILLAAATAVFDQSRTE
jgi:hypothetical protein